MALIVRMRNAGALSDWQYNSLMRDASVKGYRTGEPGGIERERSLIIEKVIENLSLDGISMAVIANTLNIPIDELSNLLFGVSIVQGSGGQSSKSKAALRLV